MARISSAPWMQPSSPNGPCRALKATSGLSRASTSATSRPTSTRVTRKPPASSASAQAVPDESDTGRSLDQPPISTATCLAMAAPPLDLRVALQWLTTVNHDRGALCEENAEDGLATRCWASVFLAHEGCDLAPGGE